ncbi:MAG TPA: DUF3014 domain-containing protein [Thermoanaerobaculia bacterium]|nr:DUF3014 domain-containing protein [Thermoanaerobaculia bacterium]
MNELDHLDIRSEDETGHEPGEAGGRRSGALWFALAGVLLIGAGVAAWLWWPRSGPTTPAPGDQQAAAAAQPDEWEPVAEEDVEPDPELPPLPESDPLVRALVSALSSHPNLAAWLANDQLVDRFTRVVANVAFDEDPRSHLPFLRPSGAFSASAGEEGVLVVDRASFARYDLVCDAIVSLDTEGSAKLYRRLLPLFQASYQELGMPGDFRDALRHAVAKVLETPSVPGDLAVRRETLAFRYQDPELEALAPLQKLLLRTGPRNAVRVKAKVREIAAAADLL